MTLLLDLDNTLVDRDAAMLAWLATIVPEAAIDPIFRLDRGGYGPKQACFKALAEAGHLSIAEARRRFLLDFPTFVRLRPDADVLLASWHGPTVLVTNGPSVLQRGKVAAAGLDGRLSHVVVSGELGVDKPDPAIFHAALARVGVSPGEALMVGDHPDNDVNGALAAGIPAVFVRSRWFDAPPAVPAIERLTELLP